MSQRLRVRYPDATIVALDDSDPMIEHTRHHNSDLVCVCGEAGQLPLPAQSIDLVFAHLLLPWHGDVRLVIRESRRVLRPDGVMIVTALGPDTLKEWHRQLSGHVVPVFADMHDLGDLMLQEGLADPVLDVNYYTVTYRERSNLIREMHGSGMLAGATALSLLLEAAPGEDGVFPVTYEVVFAHAFAPPCSDEVPASSDGTVRVPLSHLRRRLRASGG
ncbi:Malonyl-[acyl-carrier protein] O-methyltransferase [Aquicella siphonis]|uniref:Malonyl-[acyl-carrier protein] O-methyltransferase n=2 Tax=Aquicella siphonis TaxID=254247 RepID=A0A5E4PFH8_9COXI|nr:Malonyl-[acyl-carrier protein] O-methyltransferase [Aquicella siphonis]